MKRKLQKNPASLEKKALELKPDYKEAAQALAELKQAEDKIN